MKSIFSPIIISFSILFSTIIPVSLAVANQSVSCVVTGYYSPLPNQIRYVTGTYNGDKKLNGNGTNGADGTEVYPGMLAAPQVVPFGTKVEINGYGLGTVHDRGGAILTYNDENGGVVYRFDIWMGTGDEGLVRALEVGARKTTCVILGADETRPNTINFAPVVIPPLPPAATYHPPAGGANNTSIQELQTNLKIGLGKNASGAEVEELQKILKKLGYYQGVISGQYDTKTIEAVFKFQIEQGIIKDKTEYGAGFFGQRTSIALTNLAQTKEVSPPAPIDSAQFKKSLFVAPIADPQFKKSLFVYTDRTAPEFALTRYKGVLTRGDEGMEVEKYQLALKDLGYFNASPTGYYGQLTTTAVYNFQYDHHLVGSWENDGAGMIGPKTRQKIEEIKQHKYLTWESKPLSTL